MIPPILQIHALRSFSNVSLNRDLQGLEKRCRLGGVLRNRWSSQAQKYRLRKQLEEEMPDLPKTYRSHYLFEEKVLKPLLADPGLDPRYVPHAVGLIAHLVVFGKTRMRAEARKKHAAILEANEEARRTQGNALDPKIPKPLPCDLNIPLFYSEAEINYLRKWSWSIARRGTKQDSFLALYKIAQDIAKKPKFLANFEAMGSGFTAAICGRTVPGDVRARVESALAISHAFTVHEIQPTLDYFSMTDDLTGDREDPRSNLLTSGIYYQHLTLDLSTLLSNVQQDLDLLKRCVEKIVDVFSRLGASGQTLTAPFNRPGLYLIEIVRPSDAYNFADAFETPCNPTIQAAIQSLIPHLHNISRVWGRKPQRGWFLSPHDVDLTSLGYEPSSFPEVSAQISEETALCLTQSSV